jgi:hypothetical protein
MDTLLARLKNEHEFVRETFRLEAEKAWNYGSIPYGTSAPQ